MRPTCQWKGQIYERCDAPAERGAYTWKIVSVPMKQARFCFALFCAEHGALALAKGARHIHWRPKPGALPSVAGELRGFLVGEVMSARQARLYAGAKAELVRQGNPRPHYAEVMSEAIEAAEALGL